MKKDVFKNLIKEAVKEAMQEEIKDILLEAIKSSSSTPITEHKTPQLNSNPKPPTDLNQKYFEAIGETALSFSTKDAQPLHIQPGMDTVGEGTKLPDGDVPLDMIGNLLNK